MLLIYISLKTNDIDHVFMVVWMHNSKGTLQYILAASYAVKHAPTIWPRNPTPKYLLKWNETLCSHNISSNGN